MTSTPNDPTDLVPMPPGAIELEGVSVSASPRALAVAALQQNGLAVPDESILPGLERCVEKALGKERRAAWVAARDEARALAGVAGEQPGQVVFGNGRIQFQAQGMAAPGQPAVRRVIRRQVRVGGGGVQVQVEVQAGAGEVEEAAADEDEK